MLTASAAFAGLSVAALVVGRERVTWLQLLLVAVIIVGGIQLALVARDAYWFMGDPEATVTEPA